jgi:hypothetical protein
MAAATDPRRLLGRALAIFGFDGGNSRALANARGILEGLQAARDKVDALELRLGRRTPAGLGVGWPVTPPAGQTPRPAVLQVDQWERYAGTFVSSAEGNRNISKRRRASE